MKIRTGFVSNSSSSSFVIKNKKTTAQIAKIMVNIIEEDYKDDGHKGSIWYDKAMDWLALNLDYDKPIIIPWSTNYDTYIAKDKEKIMVDTCNNHPFYDMDLEMLSMDEENYEREHTGKNSFDFTDKTFMDLTTLEEVKYEDYMPLWERDRL